MTKEMYTENIFLCWFPNVIFSIFTGCLRFTGVEYLLDIYCVERKESGTYSSELGPTDIIEDDISDYPKDGDLSLSVIFQISSHILGGCGS